MKVVPIILLGLVALLALAFIGTVIIPSELRVQAEREIAAPVDMVFDRVNRIGEWEKWSGMFSSDPAIRLICRGAAAGPGAECRWSGDETGFGSGSVEIVASEPNASILTELDAGDLGVGTEEWLFVEADSTTSVRRTFDMTTGPSPVKKVFGLVLRNRLLRDFEADLERIDAQASEQATSQAERRRLMREADAAVGDP